MVPGQACRRPMATTRSTSNSRERDRDSAQPSSLATGAGKNHLAVPAGDPAAGTGHGSAEIALDYCHTVNSNIEAFLQDKSRKMRFTMEKRGRGFSRVLALVSAVKPGIAGGMGSALTNASPESLNAKPKKYSASRAASKVKRIIRGLA